jgi:hypothetical protein
LERERENKKLKNEKQKIPHGVGTVPKSNSKNRKKKQNYCDIFSIFSLCLHRFVDHCLFFCPFSIGQFIVFHLTASDFLLGIFKLFFRNNDN